MAHHVKAGDTSNHKETKAQNLVPKRVDRFYGSRQNMFNELTRLTTHILPGHNFIVAQGAPAAFPAWISICIGPGGAHSLGQMAKLVAASVRLYNQGNRYAENLRGQPMALQLHLTF